MDEKYLINKSTLVEIASAIRTQKGTTDLINPTDFASEIANLKEKKEGCRIRYIDVDGTILKEEYVQKGGTTKPPSNPSYDSDRLMFVSWNCRSDEMEWEDMETWHLVVDGDRDIGATYRTREECIYLFCKFTTLTGLNPSLAVTGNVTIDWGDGTINNLLTHTYAEAGEYIIKISGASSFTTEEDKKLMGTYQLNTAVRKCYIPWRTKSISNYMFSYCTYLSTIVIGEEVNHIGEWAFCQCHALDTVIIPTSVQTIGDFAFYFCSGLTNCVLSGYVEELPYALCMACYSLSSITIPKGVKTIGECAFESAGLTRVTIHQDVTDIIASFAFCTCLRTITLPNSLTTITDWSFRNCYCLKNIVIPSKVTFIRYAAFDNCYNVDNCVIQCTSIPRLEAIEVFEYNPSCIMWVNDDIIEDLKVATNWSTYADYMQPLSTMPQDLREELGV